MFPIGELQLKVGAAPIVRSGCVMFVVTVTVELFTHPVIVFVI
jgi:hypothetical protein